MFNVVVLDILLLAHTHELPFSGSSCLQKLVVKGFLQIAPKNFSPFHVNDIKFLLSPDPFGHALQT
jgi:hypothetical protein